MADRTLKNWSKRVFLACLFLFGVWGSGSAEERLREWELWAFPSPHDAELQRLWTQRQTAKTAGDMIGEHQLEEMIQRKLDKGIRNLWDYAILLVREGRALSDKDMAVKIGEFAQKMSPDLPTAYFYTGRAALDSNRWRLNAAVEKNTEGLMAYMRNIPLASVYLLNILYIVGFGILLAVLAFCLMVIFKRAPIYFHILKEELDGGTHNIMRGLGRIFLLALPLLLQLNILWCALFWCLILWRYCIKGEKGVIVLSFLFIVYLPSFGEALFQFLEGPRAQAVFDIYELSYGERKPQAVERLRLWSQDQPEDRDALFTLALASKKEGNFIEAKNYYDQLVKLNPSEAQGISNFANLYMAMGNLEQAISLYQKAIELAPKNGIYYFNLSKALSQKSLLVLQDADQTFQKAKELSPKQIGAQLEIDSPHPNRSVIDTIIPLEHLRRRLVAEFWREIGLSYFIVGVWLRDLSPRLPFVLPVFFVVALIVLALAGRGRGEWWRCSLCGVINNQPLGKREGRKNICVRCFRILKGKEIDNTLKENKLKETKRFQARMGVYDRISPLLIPGVGHIWKGYNVRGLIYLCIFFIFLMKFYYWGGTVHPAIPSYNYGIVGGTPVVIFVFVLFYLLIVRGVYRKEGLERSKPSFSLEGIKKR